MENAGFLINGIKVPPTVPKMRARVRWFDDEKNYMFNELTTEMEELWVINYLKKRPELETYKYAWGRRNLHPIPLRFDIENESGLS